MDSDQQLSPAGRLLVALALLAAGVLPVLAAFDVGPLLQKDIHGPPWIAGAAGGAFMLAGLAIGVGQSERLRWMGSAAGLLCAVAMAAISNWIAFGAGERQCSSTLSGVFWSASRSAGNVECRVAFGIGAVMIDGIVLWGLGAAIGKQFGPGLVQRAIENLGITITVVALSPFLLFALVVAFGHGLVTSLREYRQTGRWPRNENFIARMRARRNTPP